MTYETDRRAHDPFAPHPKRTPPPPEPAPPAAPAAPAPAPAPVDDGGTTQEDDLEGLRKPQLVDLAAELGLATSGTKDDLIDRIHEHRMHTTL